jgi:hypothetical protein
MKRIAFLLSLAVTPVLATTFTPADLSTAAKTATESRSDFQARLITATEQLRLAFAADPAAALAMASPEEAAELKAALALGDATENLRARWFMAGAIVNAAPGSFRATLYNPLARGWLVLDWDVVDGKLVVAAARVTAAGPSDWSTKPGSYLGNLVADYAAMHAGPVEDLGPYAGLEAGKWLTGAAVVLHDPARRKAADAARKLIVDGNTAKVGGGAIDTLPAQARATWWPVAGFERPGSEASLIYGSALYPHLLIAADFGSNTDPALKRLTLVNLENAGETK